MVRRSSSRRETARISVHGGQRVTGEKSPHRAAVHPSFCAACYRSPSRFYMRAFAIAWHAILTTLSSLLRHFRQHVTRRRHGVRDCIIGHLPRTDCCVTCSISGKERSYLSLTYKILSIGWNIINRIFCATAHILCYRLPPAASASPLPSPPPGTTSNMPTPPRLMAPLFNYRRVPTYLPAVSRAANVPCNMHS